MAKKFIPNGDLDLNGMAGVFARNVSADPQRFGVTRENADALADAVQAFDAAMRTAQAPSTRSPIATMKKEQARAALEAVLRPMANQIRANPAIDSTSKLALGMRERAKPRPADGPPTEAPQLWFTRAVHETAGVPEHVLEFAGRGTERRPEGATRIEVFADLVPPDVDVPAYYRDVAAPRPIYLRSYTKSPVRLVPPMAETPMRIVYFARWANAAGEVGPFSTPAVAWVEGGNAHLMVRGLPSQKPLPRVDVSDAATSHATTVMIALLSGQSARQLNAPPVMRQLEAPVEEAAA